MDSSTMPPMWGDAPANPFAERHRPPELATAAKALAGSALLLVGVSLARLLPDWEAGRWWLVSVVGLAVAALLGVLGLVRAVNGAGDAVRRSHMTGAPIGVALVVAAAVVLAAVGLRSVDDWYDLDVPTAWDRMVDGAQGEPRELLDDRAPGDAASSDEDGPIDGMFGDAVDDAEGVTAGDAGAFTTTARVGECRDGDATAPGASVDCDGPHTLEVTGQVDLLDAADTLEVTGRVQAAVTACEADPAAGSPPAGGTTAAAVPGDLEWEAGIRSAICTVVWSEPVTGRQT